MTLYLSTLRYLTLAQMRNRGKRTARRYWWRVIGRKPPQPKQARLRDYLPLFEGLRDLADFSTTAEIRQAITRAESISRNEFRFLNRSVKFDDRINWNDPSVSHLWRYHLNYFDYVTDFLIWAALGNRRRAYETFRSLALSWVAGNKRLTGSGWHPYTISLRVVNCLHALSFFAEEFAADAQVKDAIVRSVYGQLEFLSGNLEFDVRGNHLLKNLRALIWGGLAFEGAVPQAWLQSGIKFLESEVREQVLPDGGHFERTPGYHLIVLRDLLEIALWLRRNQGHSMVWLDDAVRRMTRYLVNILSPAGDSPLLKDTTWDSPFTPTQIVAACATVLQDPSLKTNEEIGPYAIMLLGGKARQDFDGWSVCLRPNSTELAASGHYVIRDRERGDFLIFDAGKPCPDYLPAHAHADLLSFELSVGQRPIIVDSGVYEYQHGDCRDFFRSTRAHNTVEIEGQNQSEVWSSFRVGRRARPGPASWKSTDEFVLVRGEHDGYQRLATPVTHQRTIFAPYGKFWLVIDQLWGHGTIRAANHVHLHPDLAFEQTDHTVWTIMNVDMPLSIVCCGDLNSSRAKGQTKPLLQGWYSERFGDLEENTVLTLNYAGSLPTCFAYAIYRDGRPALDIAFTPNGHEVVVRVQNETYALQLNRYQAPHLR